MRITMDTELNTVQTGDHGEYILDYYDEIRRVKTVTEETAMGIMEVTVPKHAEGMFPNKKFVCVSVLEDGTRYFLYFHDYRWEIYKTF